MREIKELWKDVNGYEGLYQISSLGCVKHLASEHDKGIGRYARPERLCTQHIANNGYWVVDLYKNNNRKTFLVHRLVAIAFVSNPDNKLYVNHIDSNRLNCTAGNLEWVTASENHKWSYDTNNRRQKMNWKSGAENHAARSIVMLTKGGEVIKHFGCIMDAERETGILNSVICQCLKGRYKTAGGYKWKYAV